MILNGDLQYKFGWNIFVIINCIKTVMFSLHIAAVVSREESITITNSERGNPSDDDSEDDVADGPSRVDSKRPKKKSRPARSAPNDKGNKRRLLIVRHFSTD